MAGTDGSDAAANIVRQLTPNVVLLLEGILKFHEPQFVRHLQAPYFTPPQPHADTNTDTNTNTNTDTNTDTEITPTSPQGFYPLFVDLMHCDSKLIRQTLRDIFSNRISTVLQGQQRV